MQTPLPPTPAPAPLQALPGYKPSGKIGPLAIPLLLASLLLAPPVLALLYIKSAHFGLAFFGSIYFVVGSALILGALVGAALFPAIHAGKVRNVGLATLFGLLAGTSAYGLALGLEALEHRAEIIQAVAPRLAQSRGMSEEAVRRALESELSPARTVSLYWRTMADVGLSVSRRGTTSTINGGMFVALEAIEWLLCSLAAAAVANLLAARRFSEHTGGWFTSKTVHSVLPQAVPPLIAAADAGDWEQFRHIAQGSRNPEFKEFKPPVSIHYVPEKPGGILEIRAIADPKKPLATVYERELSDAEIKRVWPEYPRA